MRYISLTGWRDLTDGHAYHEGDPFPFDGREIAEERLAELESGRNRAGLRLIRAIDAEAEPAEDRKEETVSQEPEKEPEKAKPKRNRSRK